MHSSTRTARTLVALGAIATLAACGDSTGPKAAQVPAAAIGTATTQVQAITGDATITALLSSVSSGAMVSRAGTAPALFSRAAGTALRLVRTPTQPRYLFGSTTTLAIPADMRGKAYIHDSSNLYVVDGSQTGPANGFRLALYAYNASTGVWGTSPIGYAEVTDQGTTNVQKVVVNVFANNVTNAVFSFKLVSAALAGGAQADSVAGTINAANNKTMSYVFADRTNGPEGTTQRTTETLEVDVPSANLQIDASFVYGAVTLTDASTLTTTVGGDVIRFTTGMVSSAGEIVESDTTKIDVNSKAAGFVVFSEGAQPAFHNPDGSAMSNEAKAAILQLDAMFGEVFSVVLVSVLFGLWAMTLGFQA